jgi:hypothetical protein
MKHSCSLKNGLERHQKRQCVDNSGPLFLLKSFSIGKANRSDKTRSTTSKGHRRLQIPFPPAGISDAQKLLTRLRMLALTCPGMQAHQILLQLLMRLTHVVLPDSTTTPLNDDPQKRTGSCHGFKTLHQAEITNNNEQLLSISLFFQLPSSSPSCPLNQIERQKA